MPYVELLPVPRKDEALISYLNTNFRRIADAIALIKTPSSSGGSSSVSASENVEGTGLWVTVRDRSNTRIAMPANAAHHADLVRMCDDAECPPILTTSAETINSNWASDAPFGTSQVDNFSTEWIAWFVPEASGVYQFSVDGDDSSEVMLEGRVVCGVYGGKGIDGAFQSRLTSTRSLVAGRRYLLCYRQEEGAGGAAALLYYRTPAMISANATAIVVPAERFRRPPLYMLPQLKAATFSDWEFVGQRPTGRFAGTPVPFTNGGYNWGTNWDQVSFRRTQDGMVHIRGLIGQDGAGDSLFTMPLGYRRPLPPSGQDGHNTYYWVRNGANATASGVLLRPNGEVFVETTNTWTDLSALPPYQANF